MDSKDLELYLEENRKQLITFGELLDNVQKSLTTFNDNYVPPKDEVTVNGSLTVNTEKEVEVSNISEFKDSVEILADAVAQTIKDNSHKPLEEVAVSNIKDAKTDSVTINNWTELKSYFATLAQAIKDGQPINKIIQREIKLPKSATEYLSVRLTNGKQFYDAITTAISSGGLSKKAQSNLESLKFNDSGELEVDANFSGSIDIGDVQVKNAAGTVISPATEDTLSDVKDNTSPLGSPTTTNVTLTLANTDYLLPPSEKTGRRSLIISNNSDTTIYIGQTGVIDADALVPIGHPISSGGSFTIDNSTGWYAQCSVAGKSLTVTES